MQDPLGDVLEAATTPPSVTEARRKGLYFYPNDAKATDVVFTPDNGMVPNTSGQDWDAILHEATTPGLTGRAKGKEMVRRFVSGAAEVTGDILAGIDRALEPTDSAGGGFLGNAPDAALDIGRAERGESIKSDVRGLGEAVSPDAPGFEFRSTFAENVAGGLGSTVPFLVIGAATSGAGPLAAGASIAATGSAQGFGQHYFEALANGADDETAIKAGLIGAAGGATEAFGAEFKFISRIFGAPGVGGLFRRFTTQAMTAAPREAVQEMGQQLISNVAGKLSDEDRSYLDGIIESGVIGGTIGVILGGVAELVGSLRKKTESGQKALGKPTEAVQSGAEPVAETAEPAATEDVPPPPPPADFPDLKPVAPVTTAQKERAAFAKQRGVDVVYVEDAPFKGYYKEGKAYVNAALTDQEQAGAIVYHELAHAIRDQNPKDFDRLYAAIAAADPVGLAKAQERYLKDFGAALPEDLAAEEGLARRIEELSGWIDLAHRDVRRLQDIAARNPGIITQIIDALKRIARAFGADVRTSWEQKLDELGPLVAQAGTRPEIAAQIAMRIKESLDGMVGELTNPGPGRFEVGWHGSREDFDRFSTKYIGTGEGAQAYGWGIYIAGRKAVGEYYRDALSPGRGNKPIDEAARLIKEHGRDKALEIARARFEGPHETVTVGKDLSVTREPNLEGKKRAEEIVAAIESGRALGRLYQVDLAPAEDEYLLWDKPLSEQSEKVKAALDGSATDRVALVDGLSLAGGGVLRVEQNEDFGPKYFLDYGPGGRFRLSKDDAMRLVGDGLGAGVYQQIATKVGGSRQASSTLRSLGIRGIKYLDASSRSDGDGSYNYVIFDDADVKITGKFAPHQTETAAFKAWFGDSKVVDADGKPLVVYHGTNQPLTAFSRSRGGSVTKNYSAQEAIWFADDPRVSDEYAKASGRMTVANVEQHERDVAKAKATYERLTRIAERTQRNEDWEKSNAAMEAWEDLELGAIRADEITGQNLVPAYLSIKNPLVRDMGGAQFGVGVIGQVTSEAVAGGHDGIILRNISDPGPVANHYAVFDPSQIKSATGNRGMFDPKNPDIRFAPETRQDQSQLSEILAATNKAGDEGELTDVGSSPSKIAGISADPRTRAFQRGVREVRAEGEVVVSRAEQQAKADALDRDAVLVKAETGSVLDAAETLALKDLNVAVTQRAMRKGATQAEIERAAEVSWTYQDVRREQARALGVVQDPLNQTGQEQLADIIMEPSPDARVKLERIKREMKDATEERKKFLRGRRKKILEEEAAKVERIKKKLWDSGFPPELVSRDHFTDPYLRAQIHRIISTEKTTFWDAVMEYRIASMLSGPLTHARNIAGNAAYTTYDQHLVRFSEAMVNTLFRDRNSASFKELVPFYRAQLPAMAQAGRNALLAFKTERPVWEADLKSKGVSFEEGSKIDALGGVAIPGMAGRIVRIPLRSLQAADEFFKTLVGLTETVAVSHRAALAEGLTGDALINRTHEIAADYTHPAHRQAIRSAQRVTFQGQAGPITQRVMEFRTALNTMPGGVPVGSLLLPFVKTPSAIFRIGLGLPFHPLTMMYRAASGQYRGGATKLVRDTAELVWALPIAAYLVYLVSLDDEEPLITGTTDRETAGMDRRTFPPYTVKIGGARYSYRALEPLSTSIATTIDMVEAARDSEDPGAAFGALVKSLVDQTKDKTFLRTLGDILEAAEHPDGSTLPTLVRETLITPFIPNIIRQPMAQKDKEVHTARIGKQGDDGVWTSMAKSIPYRIRPESAPVVYDLWGRAVEREGSRNPTIVRLLSPVSEATQDIHELDRLILRWNRKVKDTGEGDPFYPRAPTGTASVNGERVYLTGEQYARLTRDAGQLSVAMLKDERLNYENPTEDDVAKIKKAIEEARRVTRKRILETLEAKK